MNDPAAPFVARPSIPRLLMILPLGLGFVGLGLWIAGLFGPPPKPGEEWFGWVAVAFFGFCSIVALGRLFDRDDQIVVNNVGIYWKRWSDDTIPWTQIRRITEGRARNQRFLCIELTDPTRYSSTRVVGRLAFLNKALGFDGICLDVIGTDRGFSELREAVSRRHPIEDR